VSGKYTDLRQMKLMGCGRHYVFSWLVQQDLFGRLHRLGRQFLSLVILHMKTEIEALSEKLLTYFELQETCNVQGIC
jgi:hypothetical protein